MACVQTAGLLRPAGCRTWLRCPSRRSGSHGQRADSKQMSPIQTPTRKHAYHPGRGRQSMLGAMGAVREPRRRYHASQPAVVPSPLVGEGTRSAT